MRKIQKNLNQGKPVENPISIFEICKKLQVKACKIYVKNFIACVHFQFVTTAPHLRDRVGNSGGNVRSYNLQCGGSAGFITSHQNSGLES